MTCWGKWNATWHFIFTLFCWCLSAVETLIGQLHEAWDVQSCLFALKLVVQRKELSRLLGLLSAHFCGALQLRASHENRSWLCRSSQCLCWVYTSMFLNRPRSDSPRHLYSDLSSGACLVFWGPSASVSGESPLGGCCDRFWGRDGYRLHFIDTDTILINTVIHTTLYNLVQK